MHFSKGLFSTHAGRKCVIFPQEVAEIILLGMGSCLQKCCCCKKILLWYLSFASGDNISFPLFPCLQGCVWLFLALANSETTLVQASGLAGVLEFSPNQRALSGSLRGKRLLLSKKTHKKQKTFVRPVFHLEGTASPREKSLHFVAMFPQSGKNDSSVKWASSEDKL